MSDIEDMMNNELKEVYNELKDYLLEHDKTISEIDALDDLSNENVDLLLNGFYLHPTKEFKAEMKNLFAIAKFVVLSKQQNEVIGRIETDLSNTLDKNKINWTIHENFKNEISFVKKQEVNDESKPQSLLVKYRIDSMTDEIVYSLSGGYWGYDITKEQLKALLEGNKQEAAYKQTDFNFNVGKDSLIINVNGIQINVKKQ